MTDADVLPDIFPDYVGVTVPSTIAPLNFCMSDENVEDMLVEVSSPAGASLSVRGDVARFPIRKWHSMLRAAMGQDLSVSVCACKDGAWTRYRTFEIHVSEDEMDYGLSYRLIAPGYHNYSMMGIYERNLSNFKEKALIENTQFDGCVNCHSYNQCDPSDMSLHIRGEHGATLLRKDGKMDAYDTKTEGSVGACVYPYWHPSGDYIAYSSNSTMQTFHVGSQKLIEVFDSASDVYVYDVRKNELIHYPELSGDDAWETFPSFSPDGRTLYFCKANPVNVPLNIRDVHYDLCKVGFDPSTGEITGPVEVLVEASAHGGSVSFPRPSFDGRFIMYAMAEYGNFSIWHPESDLWLYDLATGENRPVAAANSGAADSYHNWSSNSRWFVLGSRRVDGMFTMPFISHIDENGNATKPFLVPQENPRNYYRSQMRSYNIPEFITGPVSFDRIKAEKLINRPSRTPFGSRIAE
ncbi:MAG: PD40 domain-containing protein [Bacteroidales bacterium]|nr:PD40 domain-containing protein [Candidatus Cryptobacteroides caccocaballi]